MRPNRALVCFALSLVACGDGSTGSNGGRGSGGSGGSGGGSAGSGGSGGGSAGSGGGGGGSGGVLIHAADGGAVESSDGLLTLTIPAGALASDTTLSISIVPRESWPEELAGVEPLGAVYDLQPEGLVFAEPAVVRQRFATTPAALLGADGARNLAFHNSKRPGEPAELVPTGTSFLRDGSIEIVAVLEHTSVHWAESSYRVRLGVRNTVSYEFDAEAGEHPVGEEWYIRNLELRSLEPIREISANVYAYVRRRGTPEYVGVLGAHFTRDNVGFDPIAKAFFPDNATTQSIAYDSYSFTPPTATGGPVPGVLPGWHCASPGEATELLSTMVRVNVSTVGGGNAVEVLGQDELGPASCTEVPPANDPPAGDEVLVADVSSCSLSNGEVYCDTSSGVAARIALENAEFRQHEREISPGVFVATTAEAPASVPGPPLELVTSTQHATGVFENGSYVISGLQAFEPAFASPDDALTVLSAGATVAEVPAPTLARRLDESALGEAAGLQTTFSFPDGGFDALYLHATGVDANGPLRLYRRVPATSMALANGVRTAPLLGATEVAALTAAGISLDQLTFGAIRRSTDDSIFGAPVSIVAGRFLQLRASFLEPQLPLPEPTVLDCAALPAELADREAGADTAVVCIDPADSCRVTNDTFSDSPPLASQCENGPTSGRALIFGESAQGAPYASAGPGWSLVWTTAPRSGGNAAPRPGIPESAITRRVADQADFRIDFTVTPPAVLVSSVAPHVGALPPYGESYDCATTPLTMNTAHDEGGTLFYARVCANLNAMSCEVQGDIESTPQTESCSVDWAVVLGVSPTLGPFASAGYPNGSFSINSATDGTHDGQILTGFATGTAVGMTVQDAQFRYFVVNFTYTGNGFVVNEARRR